MITRLAPSFLLFQVAALAGGWVLFVAFGTLPAVIPALSQVDALFLVASLAMMLAASGLAVLVSRSHVVSGFRMPPKTKEESAVIAFVHGHGLLALYCVPLLSLLLVTMISVAGPLASAIALALVVGGITSASSAPTIKQLADRMQLQWPSTPWLAIFGAVAILVIAAVPSVYLTAQARDFARHHTSAAIMMTEHTIKLREAYAADIAKAYGERMAHDGALLTKEQDRASRGHASQADIDALQTRVLATRSEWLKTKSEADDGLARERRELEALKAKMIALISLAPALRAQ